MTNKGLGALRLFSLMFLLPGLAGLIVSAMVSTHYLETLPRLPVPAEMRMYPRNIHGTVVYQTAREDRELDVMEYASVGVFSVGFVLGCVYLRKWGIEQALSAEDPDLVVEEGKYF